MDKLQATRLQNLKALIEQWGGVSLLAKRLGYSQPSYLSQMVHGARPISEKVARKIEHELRLVGGWFDTARLDMEPRINAAKLARLAHLVETAPNSAKLSESKRYEIVALCYEDGIEDAAHVARLVSLAAP